MRKITIELYANSEYALRERLLEIDRAISHTCLLYTSDAADDA